MRIKLIVIGFVILMHSPVVANTGLLCVIPNALQDSVPYQRIQNQTISLPDSLTTDSVKRSVRANLNYLYIPFNQTDPRSKLRIDSTIIAFNKRKQMKMIRMLAEGKVSMGYFHIDYNRLVGYNLYEGVKLGLGGETNRLISRYFTIGGYFSYGLKDASLRHGEWFDLFPSGQSDYRIHLGYTDMNMEFGGPEFLETPTLLNLESYRLLLIDNMFQQKQFTAGLEFRPINELNLYLFGDQSENTARKNTYFLATHTFDPITLTRTGLELRYSPGIKLLMEDGRLTEVTAPRADYFITIVQGFTMFNGEYSYTRLELKGKFHLPDAGIGKTTILVRGGIMSQNAPIMELFNGYGSFAGTFTLLAPFSFATMRLNEFASANFTAIHIRHDFTPWLFPEKFKKKPSFIITQNMGIGQLNDKYLTQLNLHDYRKGFFESGFEINNLLRMGYLSWCAGIYYRYGPYQFSSVHENFAYKIGFNLKL